MFILNLAPNAEHQRPGADKRSAWKQNVVAGFAACKCWPRRPSLKAERNGQLVGATPPWRYALGTGVHLQGDQSAITEIHDH